MTLLVSSHRKNFEIKIFLRYRIILNFSNFKSCIEINFKVINNEFGHLLHIKRYSFVNLNNGYFSLV